jgi:hypothetical protein
MAAITEHTATVRGARNRRSEIRHKASAMAPRFSAIAAD